MDDLQKNSSENLQLETPATELGDCRRRKAVDLVAGFGTLLVAIGLWLLPRWWSPLKSYQLKLDLLLLTVWLGGMFASVRFWWQSPDSATSSAGSGRTSRRQVAALCLLGLVLILFVLTTVIHLPRYYFIGWPGGLSPLSLLPRSGIFHFMLLSWLAVPLFARPALRRHLDRWLLAIFMLSQLLCAAALLRRTGGATLYSDDHPSFLFRLAEFWGSFPWLENYVPHWNAGVVNSVLVSSGTTGFAWAAAPLWWLADPHVVYTWALLLVQIVAIPWLTFWALRTAGLSRSGALAGGLLSLAAGRLFFVWMLHFGTVGAGLSWAVLPAAFTFLYAVAILGRTGRGATLGLILSMFFMAQWPPTMLIGLPMILLALIGWRRWLPRAKSRLVLLGSGLLVALLLGHNLVVAALGKDLLTFTTTPAGVPLTFKTLLRQFVNVLSPCLVELHPLVAVFGIGGALLLPWKRLRRWTVVTLAFMALLFSAGPLLAPRMQLERSAIAAGALAVVPAAVWLRRIWQCRTRRAVPLQAAAIALLVLGGVNTARIYYSRGYAPYVALQPSIREFADWIRNNVPEDGRLLFAGDTVHFYGRGHIAYLPILTGREMMSCDYYGFPPGMVEMDYPPKASRSAPGGMHGFMQLHGATHVVAFRPHYLEYLRSEPDLFHAVANFTSETGDTFHVFEVLQAGSRFLEGQGQIRAGFNRWQVALTEPLPEQVVIAYNWHERLTVEAPAEIFPYDTGRGATFIGIKPHGAQNVKIRYRNRF